jgi:phage terminase small subunit
MALTPKQEAFCLAFVQSDSALTAYRAAGYSANMADKTAVEAASRLLKNSNVIARIAEIRSKGAQEAAMTVAQHLADLKELREAAKGEGKYSAAVAAEVARGKVSGFYVDKVEATVTTKELPSSIDEFV